MVNVEYSNHRPTISLAGELTDELALEVLDEIRRLTTDCFYTEFLLDIASPGGFGSALHHCIRGFGDLRAGGLRIVTRVRSKAASAAAVLVSLGDRRLAAPEARLQYHNVRIVGVDGLTGAIATELGRGLTEVDSGITALLVQRARQVGGVEGNGDAARVRDFASSDWEALSRLIGRSGKKGKRESHSRLLKRLRRKVETALADAKPNKLARLYEALFDLDVPVTAVLARELRLIDALSDGADDPGAQSADGDGALRVPQWKALFRPNGVVSGKTLCRHVLILGETGAGKTASGVLPVVGASLDPSGPVGGALVIDPKHEIAPVLRAVADNDTTVTELDVRREDKRPVLDLMSGPLSVRREFNAGRVLTAARRILIRASSLTRNDLCRVLAGERATSSDPYWNMEGARVAQTVLALVLSVCRKPGEIYGTTLKSGVLAGAPAKVRDVFGALGERAGIAAPNGEIERVARKARKRLDGDGVPEVVRTDFARDVRKTKFYGACEAFEKDFEALKAECGEPRNASKYTKATRQLIESACRFSVRSKSRPGIEIGQNVLALAHEFLQVAFGLDNDPHGNKGYRFRRPPGKTPPQFLAAAAVDPLRTVSDSDEIGETLDLVESYWNGMASTSTKGQYIGAYGYGRSCLVDFADAVPARTLYFGCEPGLHAERWSDAEPDFAPIDLPEIVDGDKKQILLFRPDLGRGREVLFARALKACWFEAILNSKARQADGTSMPPVGYIADEAHRFITSDVTHGEQSFLDTCRSFNAFCVLACQSVASIRHALAEGGGSAVTNENAVEILLTNTANKIVFRSTDPSVREYLERLCPSVPGRASVVAVRPPSTLKPGECYAALSDGRFERRQLEPFPLPEPDAGEAAQEREAHVPEGDRDPGEPSQ